MTSFDKIKIISVSTQYQTYKTNISVESKYSSNGKMLIGTSSDWFNGKLYCKLSRKSREVAIFDKLPFYDTETLGGVDCPGDFGTKVYDYPLDFFKDRSYEMYDYSDQHESNIDRYEILYPSYDMDFLTECINDMQLVKIKGLDLDEYNEKPILKVKKFTAKLQFCKISSSSWSRDIRMDFKGFYKTEGIAYFSLSKHGKYVLYKFNPTIESGILRCLKYGYTIGIEQFIKRASSPKKFISILKKISYTDVLLEKCLKFDCWKIIFENIKMPEKLRKEYLNFRVLPLSYLKERKDISNLIEGTCPTSKKFLEEILKGISYTDFQLEHYLKSDHWKIIFENVKMPEKYRKHYLTTRKTRIPFDKLPDDILYKIVKFVDVLDDEARSYDPKPKSLYSMSLINKKMFHFMHTLEIMHYGTVKSKLSDYYNISNKYTRDYFLTLKKDDPRCKLMADEFIFDDILKYEDKFLLLLGYHKYSFTLADEDDTTQENCIPIVNAQLRSRITTYFDELKTIPEKTSLLAIEKGIITHLDKYKTIPEKIALFAIEKGYSVKVIFYLDKVAYHHNVFYSLCKSVPKLFELYSSKYEKIIVDQYFQDRKRNITFLEFLLCSKTIDVIGKFLYTTFFIKMAKKNFISKNYKISEHTYVKV